MWRMFNPWRLRTLRELAQRGTMAAVAELLSLSPSAVSQQIAALERESGVQLVEPDRRGVRLTVAGRALVAHAEGILAAMQAAVDEVQALDSDAVGELRLASFPSAAASICPGVMQAIKRNHPRHRISLQDLEPHESIVALRSGDIDIAIVDATGLPRADQEPEIAREELLVDPLYCVLPYDHVATRKKSVVLADLSAEDWIMEDPSSWYYRQVVDLCNAAGFQPNIVANCRSLNVVISLVRAGNGLSIQPGLAVDGYRGVVVRPLKPAVERHVYAVYRRGAVHRPSIRTALAAMREEGTRLRGTGLVGPSRAARGVAVSGTGDERLSATGSETIHIP